MTDVITKVSPVRSEDHAHPVKNWEGVRQAVEFGPSCTQRPVFGDMEFRNAGMSEDCLHLNLWAPATSATEKLPVLVYFLTVVGFLAHPELTAEAPHHASGNYVAALRRCTALHYNVVILERAPCRIS